MRRHLRDIDRAYAAIATLITRGELIDGNCASFEGKTEWRITYASNPRREHIIHGARTLWRTILCHGPRDWCSFCYSEHAALDCPNLDLAQKIAEYNNIGYRFRHSQGAV